MHLLLANMVIDISYTTTSRGKLALLADGIKYTIMCENDERILWRCASMASTEKRKCPARVTQFKKPADVFLMGKEKHVHAVLKRGPYNTVKANFDVFNN